MKQYFTLKGRRRFISEAGIAYIVERIENGDTYTEVASDLGLSTAAVYQALKRRNLAQPKINKPLDKSLLFDLSKEGLTAPQIAERMGYPLGTIYSALHHLGLSKSKQSD